MPQLAAFVPNKQKESGKAAILQPSVHCTGTRSKRASPLFTHFGWDCDVLVTDHVVKFFEILLLSLLLT